MINDLGHRSMAATIWHAVATLSTTTTIRYGICFPPTPNGACEEVFFKTITIKCGHRIPRKKMRRGKKSCIMLSEERITSHSHAHRVSRYSPQDISPFCRCTAAARLQTCLENKANVIQIKKREILHPYDAVLKTRPCCCSFHGI